MGRVLQTLAATSVMVAVGCASGRTSAERDRDIGYALVTAGAVVAVASVVSPFIAAGSCTDATCDQANAFISLGGLAVGGGLILGGATLSVGANARIRGEQAEAEVELEASLNRPLFDQQCQAPLERQAAWLRSPSEPPAR